MLVFSSVVPCVSLLAVLAFTGSAVNGQVPPAPPAPPAPAAPMAPPTPPFMIHASGSFLGIAVQEVDAERARALKLSDAHGVEVTQVQEDSPASKAGLRNGDVVLDYNGQRVEGLEQFMRLVHETPAGHTVKLQVSRNGALQSLSATIASRRKSMHAANGESYQFTMPNIPEIHMRDFQMPDIPSVTMSWRNGMLGIEGESVSSQLGDFFGVKSGVLVRSVAKGSAAEKAGIRAGDVITRIDSAGVTSPGEITGALRSARERRTFPVALVRDHREMSMTVTLEPDGRSGERIVVPSHVVRSRQIRL